MRNDILKALTRHEKTGRRVLILSLLYTIPVLASMNPIIDPDIWLHLRTGQWIIENGTVPVIDPFSIYGMGKPWIAYSWLFDLLVYGLYRAFGLVGLVCYTVVSSLLIAGALHTLVRRVEPHFSFAAVITALGLACMLPLLHPRPWLLTILFFIVELHILLGVRQSGNPRRLWLLPPLFILWANIHIQFIYGLLVLGLAAMEPLIYRLLPIVPTEAGSKKIPLGRLLLITLLCTIATLATPYHIHLYWTVLEYMAQSVPSKYVNEHLPLRLGSFPEWLVLILTLATVFSIGWRRQIQPFPLLLLTAGIFLSFRARRDVWFVVVTAATIIATPRFREPAAENFTVTKLRLTFVAAAILVALSVVGWIRNISENHLQEMVAKAYPVSATAIVERRGYPSPLYNHYNWGDYLIWRLPNLPVSMDGRTNLHGDKRIERSFKTWAGGRDWASDPELAAGRLVIANVNHALTSLLRLDSRFKLVYEDELAAVFLAR